MSDTLTLLDNIKNKYNNQFQDIGYMNYDYSLNVNNLEVIKTIIGTFRDNIYALDNLKNDLMKPKQPITSTMAVLPRERQIIKQTCSPIECNEYDALIQFRDLFLAYIHTNKWNEEQLMYIASANNVNIPDSNRLIELLSSGNMDLGLSRFEQIYYTMLFMTWINASLINKPRFTCETQISLVTIDIEFRSIMPISSIINVISGLLSEIYSESTFTITGENKFILATFIYPFDKVLKLLNNNCGRVMRPIYDKIIGSVNLSKRIIRGGRGKKTNLSYGRFYTKN